MEPTFSWQNLFFVGVPFAAYFLGIVIRKVVLPSDRSPSLIRQCLLGLPVSLVVVSPFLLVVNATTGNLPGFLITIGVVMEHGMLVNETATSHLERIRKEVGEKRSSSGDGPSSTTPHHSATT